MRPRRLKRLIEKVKLQKLADEEDDIEARGLLQDLRHLHDLATNPHTQIAEPHICLAPRFWLRFAKNRSGQVRIWLDLDRAVTLENIQDHWDEIRLFQSLLLDLEGPEKSDRGGDRYILKLHRMHKRGVSYANLAQCVEEDAIAWLEWFRSQKLTDFRKALPKIDRWSDQERNHWASECGAALQLFKFAGAKDEELIQAWWIKALKQLMAKNKRPIKAVPADNLTHPLTRQNIIETLRAFRKRFKLKEGVGKIG